MISTHILERPALRDPVLLASLPDMGDVGGLAPRYLVTKLRAKKFAEIANLERPWIHYRKGVVVPAKAEYSMYYHSPSGLIIFTGESQPETPPAIYDLCNRVLDTASSTGRLRRVYTIGGSNGEKAKVVSTVYACATKADLLAELRKYKVPLLEERGGAITWFNGVILAVAAERGIEGIGLYGKVNDPKVSQPLTVRNVLGLLITMGIIPEIDLSRLEEEHRKVQEKLNGAYGA